MDVFSPIEHCELTSIISSSEPSTCLLDPIPTKLLKDTFSLVSTYLDDGYMMMGFGRFACFRVGIDYVELAEVKHGKAW